MIKTFRKIRFVICFIFDFIRIVFVIHVVQQFIHANFIKKLNVHISNNENNSIFQILND